MYACEGIKGSTCPSSKPFVVTAEATFFCLSANDTYRASNRFPFLKIFFKVVFSWILSVLHFVQHMNAW